MSRCAKHGWERASIEGDWWNACPECVLTTRSQFGERALLLALAVIGASPAQERLLRAIAHVSGYGHALDTARHWQGGKAQVMTLYMGGGGECRPAK